MTFCWCPPGTLAGERGRGRSAGERTAGFWIAQHPVNQAQWQAVMGENPSQRGSGPEFPVDSVSWEDAKEFCKKAGLRLPFEREWENACRAGTTTAFAVSSGEAINSQLANFDGSYPDGDGRNSFKWLYRERTLPQGSFPPNAWSLHDMHGQLWEWCEDFYDDDRRYRVLRGGSWFGVGGSARSAHRNRNTPGYRDYGIGFRPCPSSTSPAGGAGTAGGREVSAERGKE